ncbi:MAG: hypothetical protein GY777_10605, partial [Candidatus Brocadiaceae bacterium]|nr:hypothetical protein [Candidatus Brocadiaceae bacterium]
LVIRIPIVNSFIEEEEQLIKEIIKEKLSVLPSLDTKVSDNVNDGDTASPPIPDKTETQTRAQADHPNPLTQTENFSAGS